MPTDDLDKIFDTPDKKAKLFLFLTFAQIVAVASMTLGIIIFILWAVGIVG